MVFIICAPKKLPLNIGPKWVQLKKKKDRVKVVIFCKFFVALIIFYIKPTCFNKHLHK